MVKISIACFLSLVAGVFYVNTYKYDSQPKYEMVSLSMHEANPGHHLQASFSLEEESFPTFRKVMEDRIYSQSPSRPVFLLTKDTAVVFDQSCFHHSDFRSTQRMWRAGVSTPRL